MLLAVHEAARADVAKHEALQLEALRGMQRWEASGRPCGPSGAQPVFPLYTYSRVTPPMLLAYAEQETPLDKGLAQQQQPGKGSRGAEEPAVGGIEEGPAAEARAATPECAPVAHDKEAVAVEDDVDGAGGKPVGEGEEAAAEEAVAEEGPEEQPSGEMAVEAQGDMEEAVEEAETAEEPMADDPEEELAMAMAAE